MSSWSDIATAPRDGTVIFVWHEHEMNRHAAMDSNIKKAQWLTDLGEWRVDGVGGNVPAAPTHWMPLPQPPHTKEREDG